MAAWLQRSHAFSFSTLDCDIRKKEAGSLKEEGAAKRVLSHPSPPLGDLGNPAQGLRAACRQVFGLAGVAAQSFRSY